MNHCKRRLDLRAALGLLALGAGVPVSAQQAPPASTQPAVAGGVISEVMVTARRRDERLEEVPMAISAFSSAQLQQAGINNLTDLTRFTPGVKFDEQGVQEPGRLYTSIRFRGMGGGLRQPFAQVGSAFLDGIYMASGVSSLGAEGFERVEVVKGPSSALFGRSTFAGAVNFITPAPNLVEYEGRVSARIAEYGNTEYTLSHEGPIVADKLAYRLFARAYHTDGQYNSFTDGGGLGEEDTKTAMLTLYAEPAPGFNIKLRGLYSQDSDGPAASIFLGNAQSRQGNGPRFTNCFDVHPEYRDLFKRNNPGVNPTQLQNEAGPLTEFFCGQVPVVDPSRWVDGNSTVDQEILDIFALANTPDGVPSIDHLGMERVQKRFALHANYTIGGEGLLSDHTLTVIGAYDQEGTNFIRDYDVTGYALQLSRDPVMVESKSYEIRFASPGSNRFTWLLGASFVQQEVGGDFNSGISVSGINGSTLASSPASDADRLFGRTPDGRCPCVSITPTWGQFPSTSNDTVGVFGQMGFDITAKWHADFEWRWQDDQIWQTDPARSVLLPHTQAWATGNGTELTERFSKFLPRFTLKYQPVDGTTLWATYSVGNIPGFFNATYVGLSAYELGVLQSLPGVNPSAFVAEETLTNYEVGWRQLAFDNRLSFAANVYHMLWEDQKTRTGFPIPQPDGSEITRNFVVGGYNSTIDGLELEGTMQLTDRLTLQLAYEFVHARFDKFNCGYSSAYMPADASNQTVCSGNTPPLYPEHSGTAAMGWNDALNASFDYFVRFDGTYKGKAFVDEANFGWIGDSWKFNLRGGVQSGNLRIEAFVINLFDDDQYMTGQRWTDFSAPLANTTGAGAFTWGHGVILTPAVKRYFGLSASFNF